MGFQGYGREAADDVNFNESFPLLLGARMKDHTAEQAREMELKEVTEFIEAAQITLLPIWAGVASGAVLAIAFSPDGTQLACGCVDKTIRFWDMATGQEQDSFKAHGGPVSCIAFNSDGTRLATGSRDGMIKIWNTCSWTEPITILRPSNPVHCVAFSPDGVRLATIGQESPDITLWDTATGKKVASFKGDRYRGRCVAFSPDGSRIACGGWDDTVTLMDSVSGEELVTFRGHTEGVNCVTFSPDGSRLASGAGSVARGRDATPRLWDIATGKQLACLTGSGMSTLSIWFSPDGAICASAGYRDIKFWNAASFELIACFQPHKNGADSIAFSPDGSRLASSGSDKTIKLWDVATTGPLGTTRWARRVVFSADCTRMAGSEGKTIIVWDAITARELAVVHVQEREEYIKVLFSPDSRLLVTDGQVIKLWDATTGRELHAFEAHKGWVHDIIFSPDSRLPASSSHFNIKVWDTSNGEEVYSLEAKKKGQMFCRFSPDSVLLATNDGECIKLLETTTFKELFTLPEHKSSIEFIVFSPDNRLLASESSGRINLWDTQRRLRIRSFESPKGHVSCVTFSPDSSRLVITFWGCDKDCIRDGVIVWDTTTGAELPATPADHVAAQNRIDTRNQELSPDRKQCVNHEGSRVFIVPHPKPALDLAAPLRAGLLKLSERIVEHPTIAQTTPMRHLHQDTIAQLADPNLTPEKRAELRMQLCTKAGQHRAATAQWQQLMRGEWPMGLGAIGRLPRDTKAAPSAPPPTNIAPDSEIRRLYLLALIDATKRMKILGHATACETAEQIAPVMTQEMMRTPTISLAMMSLMQQLAKDDSAEMAGPHSTLLKRLEEIATNEWLEVLRESSAK